MTKARLSVALRVVVSIGLLAWLLTHVPDFRISDLMPNPGATSFAWLAGAAICTLGAFTTATLRWQLVARLLDIRVPLLRLLNHYLAGQFISNILPSTIGGDVIRVRRLSRDCDDYPHSFASVILERLSGWLVLPLFTVIGLAVNPGLRHLGFASYVATVFAVGTLIALSVVVIAAGHRGFGGRFTEREGMGRFVGAVHTGLDEMRAHPRLTREVFGAAVGYQLLIVAAAVMAAKVVGINAAGITAMLAFLPAVLIAQVVAPAISGLGVREAALLLFFEPLGVTSNQAVALGLVLYFLTFGVSLLGAPAYAFGGSHKVTPDDLPTMAATE